MSLSSVSCFQTGSRSGVYYRMVPSRPAGLSLHAARSTPGQTVGRQSLEQFVKSVCQATISSVRNSDVAITLFVVAESASLALAPDLIRMAVAVMVSDAISHSFYERSSGRITVRVTNPNPASLCIDVSDDGWGLGSIRTQRVRDLKDLSAFGKVTVSRMSDPGEGMLARLVISPVEGQTMLDWQAAIMPGLTARRPHLLPVLRDKVMGALRPHVVCRAANA